MENDAARLLKKIETEHPYFIEAILTDNQGANVALTGLTSDYWQGDEAKFIRSYNDGKGNVYVSRPTRDTSTQQTIAQVSVPVMENGQVIGTLTWGVRMDQLP